jgi:hypothetical protein
MQKNRGRKFVLCVRNEGCSASLELRKAYERVRDPKSERHGYIRVVDESGEDYLFPADYFIPLDLPRGAEEAIESAAELEPQHH